MRDHTPTGYVTFCLWPDGQWTAAEGLAADIGEASDAVADHLCSLPSAPDDPVDHVRVRDITTGQDVTDQALVEIAARMIARAQCEADLWLDAAWRPYMQRATKAQIAAVKDRDAARVWPPATRRTA